MKVMQPDQVLQLFSIIFSWAVVAPISVALTGRYIYRILGFEIPGSGDDYFRIPLWPLFWIKATGSEVGFGFTVYFVTFFLAGWFLGPQIYSGMKQQLGVDLGVWTSVSLVSATVDLGGTFIPFVILQMMGRIKEKNVARDNIINRISGGR